MILLIDADSLIFSACYRTKRNPEDDIYFTDINEAIDKFDEVLHKIINDLDDKYRVDEYIIFNGSKGNFRKHIDCNYKAQRKRRELPPLLDELHKYVKVQYLSRHGYGYETDDLVASYWSNLCETLDRNMIIIVSIDKDYKQLPCLMYDYHKNKQELYDISEFQAMYNFYEQMIIGDSADNVNYCKGYGKRYVDKAFEGLETKYQFVRAVYELYQKIYKSKAREKYIQCYNLLKLKTNVI